jgi:hypothetical protein
LRPLFAVFGIHIHLPSLKDILGDTAGAFFTWLTKLFVNWYYGMVNMFEKYYVNPPVPKYGAWSDYILGSGMGLARYLATGAFAVTLVLAFLIPGRAARKLPRAFAVALGIILSPMYFWAVDQLKVVGINAAHAVVQLYHPTGHLAHQPLLLVPIVDNPFGVWAGAGPTLAQGGTLLILFMSYEVASLVVVFLLLPFFALSALYDWALKITNGLLAALLVMRLLGRPIALLFIVVARATIEHIPGLDNSVGIPALINGAMLFGLLAQPLLFWACLKIVSPITGQVYSRGKAMIRGKVDATTEERKRTEEVHRRNYAQTFLSQRGSGRARGEHAQQPSGGGSGFGTSVVKTGGVMLAKRYPATALAVKGAEVANGARQANAAKSAAGNGNATPARSEQRMLPQRTGGASGTTRTSGTQPQTGTGTTPRPPAGLLPPRTGNGTPPPPGRAPARGNGILPQTGRSNGNGKGSSGSPS